MSKQIACGSKELRFPLSPSGESRGGFPHAASRAVASKQRWDAPCTGSPHKRAAPPCASPAASLQLLRLSTEFNFALAETIAAG